MVFNHECHYSLYIVHAFETTVCNNAKHGERIPTHGLKSSQNAVNLKNPQIALLQNVELKVKPLEVYAFETTVCKNVKHGE